MRVLLVGCGKMGGALLARWQTLGLYSTLYVIEPSLPETGAPCLADIADIPAGFTPDIVVFAVKPQILPEILPAYAGFRNALFLSIAAGRTIGFFEQRLPAAAVVRAMPNTPAAIGEGVTVACANAAVTPAQKEQAEKLLSAVGDFMWVADEKLLDPVTALSGSGPAYVFLLVEAMTQAGIKLGLVPDMAEKLARKTVTGSAALAAQSPDMTAADLRRAVTSPGGTTAAALEVLMTEPAMQDLFDRALAAASRRAGELSAG